MKALVKKYKRPGLWLDDVPLPKPGVNEVRIKIRKTAICGTDVHIYDWDTWARKTIAVPMIIGHEFVGTIDKLGRNVDGLKVGDLVCGEGHLVCGKCRNCLAGRRHLCKDTCSIGVNRSGAFAEYLTIPAANAWVCDPRIPLDILAIFDPFGNAVHTALTYDLIGEDVLITGAGPIGLMAAAVARHAGARHVVVADINPYRLDMAKRMGVTRAVNMRTEEIGKVMKALDMKEGFDVGMEMSGNKAALQAMLENMFHGGKIALLGILGENVAINWDLVVFNCLTLKGIYGREMFETWYKMRIMIQSGLDIAPVITHRFHYTEFKKGFKLIRSGLAGKIILDWTD